MGDEKPLVVGTESHSAEGVSYMSQVVTQALRWTYGKQKGTL